VQFALDKYSLEMHQLPSRVVIHKSSRWTDEEKTGVREGLRSKVSRYDLVALQRQDSVRLITASKYPPLRGTRFTVGDLDFLYTTGFVAELGQFHGMHVPSPLLVADHLGSDTPREAAKTSRTTRDVIKSRLQVRGKQTALSHARMICLRSENPLAADEIARRILANGYSSRSKTFTDYVRRLLRQDGRFVTNAEGQWMLRAAA
jgi:hypothetical protein